jgi:hypothetical protein
MIERVVKQKIEKYEPVPKLIDCALDAHGFGTGSWKNHSEARFFNQI